MRSGFAVGDFEFPSKLILALAPLAPSPVAEFGQCASYRCPGDPVEATEPGAGLPAGQSRPAAMASFAVGDAVDCLAAAGAAWAPYRVARVRPDRRVDLFSADGARLHRVPFITLTKITTPK